MTYIVALAKSFLIERWRYVFILYWSIGWFGGIVADHFHISGPLISAPSVLVCVALNVRHYKLLERRSWF